jgi:hypothetical protein
LFLYIQMLCTKIYLWVSDFNIKLYALRFKESIVPVNCCVFLLCWCTALDIFHMWAAYHFWDMYVNFCIKIHDFCTSKMLPARIILPASIFYIRLYAFRFEENIVPVNCRIFFNFVGAQLWSFFLGRQHIIFGKFM